MSSSPRRLVDAVLVGLSVLVLCGLAFVGTGQTAFVSTEGVSMNPVYYEGDLVVIARSADYETGEIVAYERPGHSGVVLHRLVGGDADGYVFKGDNNESVDPTTPTASQLVGRAVLRVPRGGAVIDRLTDPTLLGLLAFGLITAGGSVAQTRRRNRKRSMSQHAHRTRPSLSLSTLPPLVLALAAASALLAILGGTLGAFAWTGPTTRSVSGETSADRTVTFSYLAQVPRTAAYDDTLVRSPEPVFRAVTDTVDLRYRYLGEPGSVRVSVEMSAANGWRSTVPLAGPASFDDTVHNGSTILHLPALEKRAQKAADVIGVPAGQVDLTVRAHFRTEGAQAFVAELPMTLSATHLTLVDPAALSVTDSSTTSTSSTAPRTLGLAGHEIEAVTARSVSLVLLMLALLTAVGVIGLARAGAPESKGAAIRRRHANLLVRVEPISAPTGRPVIDVSEFATLVKLAERYGLLVLHWSRSNVETFVVQDESLTYRYRSAAGPMVSTATGRTHVDATETTHARHGLLK